MCGICGVYNLDGSKADAAAASAMSRRLAHRGPDDSGEWSSGPAAFAFRRLSILDLAGGHQPMSSEDGRLTVVFNGEIYNHPELRRELEASGARYRTRSDTETILRLYGREGPSAFVRLDGMFAVGLWDSGAGELVLARDPLGIKPLYYGFDGRRLVFASELRALLAAGISDRLDREAILEYLAYGCVRAPRTALAAARKLPPGHLLRVTKAGLRLERYWELPPPSPPLEISPEEAQAEVERLLAAAVRRQLLSDVPVGAFLSGGTDSSLVAALMARASGGRVPTFTIGFKGARAGLDESRHAAAVGRSLGAEHHELILPSDVLDRIEELVLSLDEPIADSAILPTHLLARFARSSVKVVLTGEGADELFAGYGRYKAAYLSEAVGRAPAWARPLAAWAARGLGKGRIHRRLPYATAADWARANAHATPEAIEPVCRPEFFRGIEPPDPMAWMGGGDEAHTLGSALAYDLRTVLCDSLLMKVDKSTMRASLEARVPFLDKRLVEFAVRLPASVKMRRLKGKHLLRRIAARYLPSRIAWRRKHGFITPWDEWVRRPRNPAVDDLLSGSALASCGAFEMGRVREMRRRLVEGLPVEDDGLFFRIVVLGLWLESLGEYRA